MRRILGHSVRLFLGLLLAGLGYELYENLGPVERWRIPMDPKGEVWHSFSQNGRFTFSYLYTEAGRCRIRDAATGAVVTEFSHGEYDALSKETQPGPCHWAGLPTDNTSILDLLDLENGTIGHIPITPFAGPRNVMLSNEIVVIFYVKTPIEQIVEGNPVVNYDIRLHALPNGEPLDRLSAVSTNNKDDVPWGAQFSPKGSYFIFQTKRQDELGLRLWDVRLRKAAAFLPGTRFLPSPDDRYLLVWQDDDNVSLWDLANLAEPVAVAVLPCGSDKTFFTPDSKTLATFSGEQAVFWESATGKEKGKASIPPESPLAAFSPDSHLLAVFGDFRANVVSVLDVDTREVLWNCPFKWGCWEKSVYFGADGSSLVIAKESDDNQTKVVELHQARTGKVLATFPLPIGSNVDPVACGNGRRALISYIPPLETSRPSWFQKKIGEWLPFLGATNSDGVWARVIDLQERREIFRLPDEHKVRDCFLSWDGSALISYHFDSPEGPHVRCYDIPTRHPWATIVGIPAGLAIIFLLLEKWWKRRRRSVVLVPGPT